MTLALLVACAPASGTSDAIADYDDLLARMSVLVADHGSAVAGAATLDDARELETAHATDWDALSVEMREHMGMMGDCKMGDDVMDMMDAGMMSMDDMDLAVSEHVAAHDGHTDVADCPPAEDGHAATMTGHMDAMGEHSGHFSGAMDCSGGMAM